MFSWKTAKVSGINEGESSKSLQNHGSSRRGIGLRSSSINMSQIERYDYCLVFPGEKKRGTHEWDVTERGSGYLEILRHLGFEMYTFKVVGQKPSMFSMKPGSFDNHCLIYVLLRAPLSKLREHAERIDLKILLDPEKAEKSLELGDPEKGIAGVKIRHEPNITLLQPCECIYGYYRSENEALYWKPTQDIVTELSEQQLLLDEDLDHPFRDLLRLKVSAVMLQSRPRYLEPSGEKRSTQNLKIQRYLKKNYILGCFLLQKDHKNIVFRQQWVKYPVKPLPSEAIKEYFGEKIAFYHVFKDHYTNFLWFPAIVAIPFQVASFYYNDYSPSWIPFYSLMLPMWSVVQIEVTKHISFVFVLFVLFIFCFLLVFSFFLYSIGKGKKNTWL
jgi:hypothetical protein